MQRGASPGKWATGQCSGVPASASCLPAGSGSYWDVTKPTRHHAKAPPAAKRPRAAAEKKPGPPHAGPAQAATAPAPSRLRVLIAHRDAALLRLARESLETFLDCEVRTTSSALGAFDRLLQEPYRLLLLDLHLTELPGELLYDLISRAYPKVHPGSLTAPPVIWLGLATDLPRQDELTREARTKALLLSPLNIQRLLDTAGTLLPRKG